VADIARQLASDPLIAFVDSFTEGRYGRPILGLPVFEKMEELATVSAEGECQISIAFGDCATRLCLMAKANALGFRRCPVLHPRAIVAI
jgi:hypothetical protein